MRSRYIDAPTLSKMYKQQGVTGGPLAVAVATIATINFTLDRMTKVSVGHVINCNHDNSATLSAVYRSIILDGLALYQTEFGVSAVPYSHAYASGETTFNLGAGAHIVTMIASSQNANIWSAYDGYIYVKEF